MHTRLLGKGAPPLLVIAPRPLQRVLTAVCKLEPMAFRYVDCASTSASGVQVSPPGIFLPCVETYSRSLPGCARQNPQV